MTKVFSGGVAALVAACGASTCMAEMVLEIDITNPHAVVVRSAGGAAAFTGSSDGGWAMVLAGSLATLGAHNNAAVVGDFRPVGGSSYSFAHQYSQRPDLMALTLNAGGASTAFFTAGQQAFTGSSVLDPTVFGTMAAFGTVGDVLVRNRSGNLTGQVVGQYRIVPAPASLALVGLGGLVAARRRR